MIIFAKSKEYGHLDLTPITVGAHDAELEYGQMHGLTRPAEVKVSLARMLWLSRFGPDKDRAEYRARGVAATVGANPLYFGRSESWNTTS